LLSGTDASNEAVSIRQELEITRREYAMARQRYTDDHPDVRTLANKIDILERQLAIANAAPQVELETRPDNPAYISLLVQIEAADTEMLALRQRARSLRQRIGRYEALLLEAPQVEREYLALQREYDQAVQEFNEVREKQTDAQQARDLEISEKGERYVLQRTPSEPTSAAFPNRIAIIILGIIFAIASALGAVVISEALDVRVRSIRDLRKITGIPPIATIPVLETQAESRRKTIIWSSSVFGVASILIYMITI